jgi:hypothetical protein
MGFRVCIEIPGEPKPHQALCSTRKQAERFLELMLSAGQPKGTVWKIWESKEVVVLQGRVE